MTKGNIIEGTVTQTRGNRACIGNKISVVRKINANDFKEEIFIMGEDGYRGYPSEELFIELYKIKQQGGFVEGEILETKKEGICHALFHTYY